MNKTSGICISNSQNTNIGNKNIYKDNKEANNNNINKNNRDIGNNNTYKNNRKAITSNSQDANSVGSIGRVGQWLRYRYNRST